MEENRSLSWTDLFIKVILIVIFVLFTVWLLSLSNRSMTNSLDVLTDNIFAENIDRMKEVGKEYFTTERLPKKIGEIKTITLKELYEKKLILEIKDKNGNACDANDSYISIEKMENEYQMKVNLECDDEEKEIIVIMGCYNYCDTDICEKKDEVKEIEYQYSKTTGGKWTDYGKWSEWNKKVVTANNYRQVETKKVNEEYTYEEVITKTLFDEFEISCPEGYTLSSDKTKCYKVVSTTDTKEPTCLDRTSEGYTLVGRDGFTCNYSKKVTTTQKVPVTTPKTCYRQEVVMSCNGTCAPVIQNIPYQCGTTTTYKNQPVTTTVTDTTTASCPSGYTKSGTSCSKVSSVTMEEKITKTCLDGYKPTSDGTKCYKDVQETVKKTGTRDVIYYRYRTRQYIGGTTDYKWSKSKNDKDLLNAGYKLTGKTR